MFGLVILLLLIALVAYFLGDSKICSLALKAALIVAVVLIVLTLLIGGPYFSWPYYRAY